MPGDEDHAIADQLTSERHGLIRIAEVVADDQLDALAEDSAIGPATPIRISASAVRA